MNLQSSPPHLARQAPQITSATTLLLALACGATVANIYYAQPLAGEIARSLGMAPATAGLVVTMTQVGYVFGLLFLVPLADLVENRRLIVVCTALDAVALACAAFAPTAAAFLAAAAAIGVVSVAVQIVVPLAAHLAPDATRGKVVGMVTSGLMIGILAARPLASLIAAETSWRAVFVASSVLMVALTILLSRALPYRAPEARMSYVALLRSMARLAAETPILRLRALYQAALFTTFSLFWTTSPLLLAGPDYGFTQRGIGLFALVGVSGAIAAPIAGRLADRGYSLAATGAAILLVALGLIVTLIAPHGSTAGLASLAFAAVAIDFGVQSNLVLGYRAIFNVAPDARARLNAVYLASLFASGAVGSALGVWAFAHGGWRAAVAVGLVTPCLAMALFLWRLARGRA
jgi:predicted MFS family arabinose efflux permease